MSNPRTKGNGACYRWLIAHVDYQGDDCLIWPFSCNHNGHGTFGYNGRSHRAHQFMCELVNGPRPTPQHESAHSCGRGHEACVSPRHLSWKTRPENQADRYVHNRKSGKGRKRFKLTAEQVAEIRALEGAKTVKDLAEMFRVSRGAIRQILAGQTWKDGTCPRQFTADEVAAIQALQGLKTLRAIGAIYGVGPSVIWRIHRSHAPAPM